MTLRKSLLTFGLFCTAGLAACGGDVKEELGLKVEPPDEFSVVTRAPLSVPPDYTLRPPRPGADRPMELNVRDRAKKTVFGTEDMNGATKATRTGGQDEFLSKLGADEADTQIRSTLNAEVRDLDESEQAVAEKLLFWKSNTPQGKVIDPVEEKKMLEKNAKKSSSEISIEKRNEDILETP